MAISTIHSRTIKRNAEDYTINPYSCGASHVLASLVTCILIVDDSPRMRKMIRGQLERAGVEVCVEAADGLDALEQMAIINPDLVILDIALPGLNGIEAAREIGKMRPGIPIVLHTLHAELILSQGLPESVSDVIAKGEPLVPRVLSLLQMAQP